MPSKNGCLLVLGIALTLLAASCGITDPADPLSGSQRGRGERRSGSEDQFNVGLVRVSDLEATSGAAFSNIGADRLAEGTVEVDELGKNEVEVRVRRAAANTTYTVNFCSFATARSGCFAVAALNTDAEGNGKVEFRFPQRGGFAGIFLLTRSSQDQFVTGFTIPAPRREGEREEGFEVNLRPIGVIGAGLGGGFGPNGDDPLVRGQVEVERDRQVEVKLAGAATNATYAVKFCRFGRSAGDCINILGQVLTDAQGNARAELNFPVMGTFDGIFILTHRINTEDRNEFATAFSIL